LTHRSREPVGRRHRELRGDAPLGRVVRRRHPGPVHPLRRVRERTPHRQHESRLRPGGRVRRGRRPEFGCVVQ